MLYSAHQPDLLPYSGFFYKMAKADVFDLKIWDQFVNRGYQRRVMMREKWATIPLEPGSSHDPIFDKRVKPEAAQVLADQVLARYGSKSNGYRMARFFDHEDRGAAGPRRDRLDQDRPALGVQLPADPVRCATCSASRRR